MNKLMRNGYTILVVVACMGPFFMQARLDRGSIQNMVGSPSSVHNSTAMRFDDPCQNLQNTINNKSINSTYLSARYQHCEGQVFASGCSLTFPGDLQAYADISYSSFSSAVMIGIDMSQAMINGVNFTRANLTNSIMKNVNAAAMRVNFSGAILQGVHFEKALLQSANLESVRAQGAWFVGANLMGAHLSEGDFSGAYFSGANLMNVDAKYTKFNNANFTGATVSGDISGANFTGATGITASAFIQLHYVKGHPPIGLPDEIMKDIWVAPGA